MSPHLPIAVGLLFIAVDAGAVVVDDDLGHRVMLSDEARRIVTLAPHATELVIAAGLGQALVGVAAGGAPPAALDKLPRVGTAGALDREALKALQPDLVVGWYSGNRVTDLAWIKRNGIALYLSEPSSLQQIADSIRALGMLGGSTPTAMRNAAAFERSLRTDCADLPIQELYVEVWNQPAMTVGGRHWINAALAAAGYRNRFGDVPLGVFTIAEEARFANRDVPRVSLIRTFDSSHRDKLAKLLSLPGPRLGHAIQMLCERRLGSQSR